MVKMLTVLVSIISKSEVFLLKKCEYAIFNDQSFNNTLTKDIVSFEQPGSDKEIMDLILG